MVDQMDDHDPDLARFTNDAGSDGEAEDPFFSHLGELFFCVVDVVAQDDMVCLHFVVEISTLSIWCCPHITCYVCLHWGHEHESNKTIFALRFAVHGSKTWPLKTGDDVRCRWPSSCHRHFGSCVARFQSVLKSQRVAFLRVNSIPCDVYGSLEMTGRTSCSSSPEFFGLWATRATTQKGAISPLLWDASQAEAIVSKNASKLASLWRNWEASSNDLKDANFTEFHTI